MRWRLGIEMLTLGLAARLSQYWWVSEATQSGDWPIGRWERNNPSALPPPQSVRFVIVSLAGARTAGGRRGRGRGRETRRRTDDWANDRASSSRSIDGGLGRVGRIGVGDGKSIDWAVRMW